MKNNLFQGLLQAVASHFENQIETKINQYTYFGNYFDVETK